MASSSVRKVNILCLDGGGVRGLSTIQVLKRVDEILRKQNPKWLTEYFDIICGTSTGGILALALGLCDLSLDECERLYKELGQEVFGKSPISKMSFFEKVTSLFSALNDPERGKADTKRLEEILKNFLKGSMYRPQSTPRVFTLASNALTEQLRPFLVCSYDNPEIPSNATHHQRVDYNTRSSKNWEIWEAARATSAAPFFFDTFKKELNGIEYKFVDGGLVANNPAELAIYEARRLFSEPNDDPNFVPRPIGLVLSIGTGTVDKQLQHEPRSLLRWGSTMVDLATDSDRAHHNLERWRQVCKNVGNETFEYIRFNPPSLARYSLDDATDNTIKDLIVLSEEDETAATNLGNVRKYFENEFPKQSQ